MEICIDFDGTCVTHAYPEIGLDVGAVPVLRALIEKGHDLILFTMRSGIYLDDALSWFHEHDIDLYGVNVNPTQHTWTGSPKAYGQLYIDDAALGAPLIEFPRISQRPYIDWTRVETMLKEKKIL